MNISVASGKGGTGKTTIALALATLLSQRGIHAAILDCDVEEPNVNLFLKADIHSVDTVYTPVPSVDEARCNGCGKCEQMCRFSAIVIVGGKPLVLPDMCHSCGGCYRVCPEKAIQEIPKEIGGIEEGLKGNLHYAGGRLRIGEPMAAPLIKEVKQYACDADVRVIDCPPGTSCSAIESVRGSDYVILIAEPTPFGLNDLQIIVGMLRQIEVGFGVVINKSDIGDDRVYRYCREEAVAVLASIPYSPESASEYASGFYHEAFIERFSAEFDSIITSVFSGKLKGVCRNE